MTKCEKKQEMLLNYDHSRFPRPGGDERVKRHRNYSTYRPII